MQMHIMMSVISNRTNTIYILKTPNGKKTTLQPVLHKANRLGLFYAH